MLHEKMRLQNDLLPPGLTFEQGGSTEEEQSISPVAKSGQKQHYRPKDCDLQHVAKCTYKVGSLSAMPGAHWTVYAHIDIRSYLLLIDSIVATDACSLHD